MSNDLLVVSELVTGEAYQIPIDDEYEIIGAAITLNVEECIAEIEAIEANIEVAKQDVAALQAGIKEAEKYWAECRLRLGEELKKQKDEDGVTATILTDGRTVTSRALPAKLVIVDESKIPQQYITYEKVMVEKKVIDKAAIMRDGNVEGTVVEPVKYTIQIKNGVLRDE